MKRSFVQYENCFFKLGLILPLVFSLSSCVYLAVGSIGALGGYMVSPDTVEGVTENDLATTWDYVVEVTSIMGTIEEQYPESGLLFARISGAEVTVSLLPITDTSVKVSVKARKSYFPKVRVAQDVYVKIMKGLNE